MSSSAFGVLRNLVRPKVGRNDTNTTLSSLASSATLVELAQSIVIDGSNVPAIGEVGNPGKAGCGCCTGKCASTGVSSVAQTANGTPSLSLESSVVLDAVASITEDTRTVQSQPQDEALIRAQTHRRKLPAVPRTPLYDPSVSPIAEILGSAPINQVSAPAQRVSADHLTNNNLSELIKILTLEREERAAGQSVIEQTAADGYKPEMRVFAEHHSAYGLLNEVLALGMGAVKMGEKVRKSAEEHILLYGREFDGSDEAISIRKKLQKRIDEMISFIDAALCYLSNLAKLVFVVKSDPIADVKTMLNDLKRGVSVVSVLRDVPHPGVYKTNSTAQVTPRPPLVRQSAIKSKNAGGRVSGSADEKFAYADVEGVMVWQLIELMDDPERLAQTHAIKHFNHAETHGLIRDILERHLGAVYCLAIRTLKTACISIYPSVVLPDTKEPIANPEQPKPYPQIVPLSTVPSSALYAKQDQDGVCELFGHTVPCRADATDIMIKQLRYECGELEKGDKALMGVLPRCATGSEMGEVRLLIVQRRFGFGCWEMGAGRVSGSIVRAV